jgi:hypothetical protein
VYAADAAAESSDGRRGKVDHASFLPGKAIGAAGELAAKRGWLKMISSATDAYDVDGPTSTVQAIDALDAKGVNTDAAVAHHHDKAEDTHDYFNARAYKASGGNASLLTAHKAAFGMIHEKARSRYEPGMTPEWLSSVDQQKTDQTRRDGTEARPIDVRGLELAGQQAGDVSEVQKREEKEARGKREEEKRNEAKAKEKAEAEKKERAKAQATAAANEPSHAPPTTPSKQADPGETRVAGPPKDETATQPATLADYFTKPRVDGPPKEQGAYPTQAPRKTAEETYGPSDFTLAEAKKTPEETYGPSEFTLAEAKKTPEETYPDGTPSDTTIGQPTAPHDRPSTAPSVEAAPTDQTTHSVSGRGDGLRESTPKPLDVTYDSFKRSSDETWSRKEGKVVDGKKSRPTWRSNDADRLKDPQAEPKSFYRGAAYADEDKKYFRRDPSLPKSVGERTAYFDDAEREAHELHAKDGRLMRADGTAMDTSGGTTALAGGGADRNIFALDSDYVHGQKLYAADAGGETAARRKQALEADANGDKATVGHVHHSSFTGGQDLDGVGDMEARQGWLKKMSNDSGHHRPDMVSNLQTLQHLDRMGVNTDVTTVENKRSNGTTMVGQDYRALAVLATGNDCRIMDKHKNLLGSLTSASQGAARNANSSPAAAMRAAVKTENEEEAARRAAAKAGATPGPYDHYAD